MIDEAVLYIRLTPGAIKPAVGHASVNEIRGGPATLLAWLETQLGLRSEPVLVASRITEYASV